MRTTLKYSRYILYSSRCNYIWLHHILYTIHKSTASTSFALGTVRGKYAWRFRIWFYVLLSIKGRISFSCAFSTAKVDRNKEAVRSRRSPKCRRSGVNIMSPAAFCSRPKVWAKDIQVDQVELAIRLLFSFFLRTMDVKLFKSFLMFIIRNFTSLSQTNFAIRSRMPLWTPA